MFCKNCGKELPDNSTFCGYCGTKVEDNQKEKLQNITQVDNEKTDDKVTPETDVKDEVVDTEVTPDTDVKDEVVDTEVTPETDVKDEVVDAEVTTEPGIDVETINDEFTGESDSSNSVSSEQEEVKNDELEDSLGTEDSDGLESAVLASGVAGSEVLEADEQNDGINNDEPTENDKKSKKKKKVKKDKGVKKPKKKVKVIVISIIVAILLIAGGAALYIDKNIFYKMNITIKSNVDDADVYIDGEKVGVLKNGVFDLTNVRWHKDMNIYLKKDVTGDLSDLSIKRVIEFGEFKDQHGFIELKLKEPLTKSDIKTFLDDMYGEMALSDNNVYDAVKFMSYFVDKEKNPEFKDFAKLMNTFLGDKELHIMSITPTVETIKRIGSDEYEVSYIVAYRFYWYDQNKENDGSYTLDYSKKWEKEQVFRYNKAIFVVSNEESDDNDSSDNHSIKIKSLGGDKGFKKISDNKHLTSTDGY